MNVGIFTLREQFYISLIIRKGLHGLNLYALEAVVKNQPPMKAAISPRVEDVY